MHQELPAILWIGRERGWGGGVGEGYLEHREGMLGRGSDEPRQVGEHHRSGCSMSVQQHFGGPLYSTLLPLQLLTLSALILICNLLHSMLDQMNDTAYLYTTTWSRAQGSRLRKEKKRKEKKRQDKKRFLLHQ